MSRRDGRDRGSRRRSRSWSRSRSRSPGRHSLDGSNDIFGSTGTSDPHTLDARVFIGSLSPEVTKEMLQNYFSKFGEIKGVMRTRRKYGFVQFATEQESNKCLADSSFALIDGHKLDVKPAKIRLPGEEAFRARSGSRERSGWGGGGGREDRGREGSRRDGGGAARRRTFDDDYYHRDYYRSEAGSSGREPPPAAAAGYSDDYMDYYREYYDRYYRDAAARGSGRDYPSLYDAPPQQEPLDPLDSSRPNDVEIVAPNKMQRGYAERIETELRKYGLLVDLLFPPGDVSSSRVLADLTNRRCLYAIFVTEENEKHHSISLNILHGTPQEHRNMPLDDAFLLVQRNFEDYVTRARRLNTRQHVPRDIRNLFLDLLEARYLAMADLDKLMSYLKERQNVLVDEQNDLKRDMTGALSSHAVGDMSSSSLSRGRAELSVEHDNNMAITYPGYNYQQTSSSGARGGVGAPPPLAGGSSSMNVGYPPGLPSSSSSAATSLRPPLSTQYHVQYPGSYTASGDGGGNTRHHHLHGPPPAAPGPTSSALQDRILNIMKSNTASSGGGMVGVPPPVPAPTAVPPPSLMGGSNLYGGGMSHGGPTSDSLRKDQSGFGDSYQGWRQ